MKRFSLLIILITIVASCNNSDQEAKQDTVPSEDTTGIKSGNELNDQTTAELENAAVFRFTRSRVPEFSWNTFQLTRFWTEDSMSITPFEPAENYFQHYGPFLKYSPDSSRFIDLDSYNISISTNAKGERTGIPQGPDTEVSLVDLDKKIKTRLLFVGPGNNVEDASWLDNQNLVLISSVDNKEAPPNVSLIKFNLPSKTFQVYETADTSLIRTLKGYSKAQRLKGLKMQ